MRGVRGGIFFGSLIYALGAVAVGDYQYPPEGRNFLWPPPGGLYQSQPPAWTPAPLDSGQGSSVYGEPGPRRRYLPSYRYRGQFVPPPGPDWPDADYPVPAQPAAAKPPPLEPGHPVEVVPPPGIPVDEVKQEISRQPKRGWRPVDEKASLPAEPTAARPAGQQGERATAGKEPVAPPVPGARAEDAKLPGDTAPAPAEAPSSSQ